MTRPGLARAVLSSGVAAPAAWLRAAELPARVIAHRRAIVVALHLVLVPLVYATAFAVRFDFAVPPDYARLLARTLPVVVGVKLLAFWRFGLFSGWWRHVGMYDLAALLRASAVASLCFVALASVSGAALPRSVALLDWVLTVAVLGGARFAVRWVREGGVTTSWNRGGRRTLIVGAGDAGARLLREVRVDPGSRLHPVGFVDESCAARGLRIHGVPVLGTLADLRALVVRHRIELLVVTNALADGASNVQMRALVEQCAGLGVEVKILPPLGELVDGRARANQLRDVALEDLLGRQPVQLDMRAVAAGLRGRTVLITGGAGSIGSELARQVAALEPERLVLVDKAESALYFVQLELARRFPSVAVVPVIADVTNRGRLDAVFAEHWPSSVFHAAAYKHVPLMERNVLEAVRNNVLGTLCVAEVAAEYGADRFVLISTDKAVHPSSVMGATKRVAERIILALPEFRRAHTEFRAVRFGNVLGSDGSVVPVFKRQIAAGGPVTVTHPEVTRYFMTIPEAVQLVLQAGVVPECAGRIAMLDMGDPVRIVDLAENLIRLSGLEPYAEMPIEFTGLRPGEKLHEELCYAVETTVATGVSKIRVVQSEDASGALVREGVDALMRWLELGAAGELLATLRELVPECVTPLRDRPVPSTVVVADGRRPTREVVAPRDGSSRTAGLPPWGAGSRVAPLRNAQLQ